MKAIHFLSIIVVLAFMPQKSFAQPPALFALTHIYNESGAKATIYFRWGNTGPWGKFVIEKGMRGFLNYAYDNAAKTSPDLYVRMDVDTNGVKIVEHVLSRGQSPDDNSINHGHHFRIKQLTGTDTRYIEVIKPTNAKVRMTDARSSVPKMP